MNNEVASKLKATVNRLVQAGITVAIIGESPAFNSRAPNIAAALLQAGKQPVATETEADTSEHEICRCNACRPIWQLSRRPARITVPDILFGERLPLLTSDGVPIYFDHSHLTEAGSILYAEGAIAATIARSSTDALGQLEER